MPFAQRMRHAACRLFRGVGSRPLSFDYTRRRRRTLGRRPGIGRCLARWSFRATVTLGALTTARDWFTARRQRPRTGLLLSVLFA